MSQGRYLSPIELLIKGLLFLGLLLAYSSLSSQAQLNDEGFEYFEYEDGDTTYMMKKYFLVVYTSGPNRNQSVEEANKLQAAHLAHQGKMAEDKKLCVAGPMGDDGDWRGILILNVPNEEEAKSLIENDPMIKAGRLNYILKPWWGAVGTALY